MADITGFFFGLWAAAAGLVCLLTLAGFAGRFYWVLDLASHFRVQYFWLLTATGLVFVLSDRMVLGLIYLFFALVNLAAIAPWKYYRQVELPQRKTYRLLSANVLQTNQA